MTRTRQLLILSALVLLLSQCSLTEPADEEPPPPRALTSAEKQIARSDNHFGLRLFRSISASESEADVVVSPLSVSMALGMTLNGARGETREAMQETLALTGLSDEEINTAYERLIQLLIDLDPAVTLGLANSIWYSDRFDVEPAFVEVNREHFDAEVRALAFEDPDALETINGWVEAETEGKIDEILGQIDPDEVMFLINALYFNGPWTYAFDEADTREAPFTRHDGTEIPVSMMHQTATLPYLETDAFQAVDVPYGDSLFSMTVFLPREGRSVNDFVDSLDAERWADWSAQFEPQAVDLRLPRFTLSYEQRLDDALKSLGMDVAFSCERADFSGIGESGGLCISRVEHKTHIEVSEAGTEAAAATAVGIQVRGVGGGAIPVHVDRPFAFLIRDRHSGTVLFAGKINRLASP